MKSVSVVYDLALTPSTYSHIVSGFNSACYAIQNLRKGCFIKIAIKGCELCSLADDLYVQDMCRLQPCCHYAGSRQTLNTMRLAILSTV